MTTDGFHETIQDGEDAKFERLAKRLVPADKADGRTLHRHSQAGLAGKLVVADGLPEPLAQGLFAKPATYECYVRFSSGSGTAQSDRAPDVRGLALKVVGVDGPKLIPGLEAARTQDFLAILSRTFPFVDPEVFVDVAVAARDRGTRGVLSVLMKHYGFWSGFRLGLRLGGSQDKGKQSLAERTFYVPLAVRWGTGAAKVRFRPVDLAPAPAGLPGGDRPLTDELRARVAKTPLAWAVEAQLFVDDAKTPIEDPTVEWTDAVSPFVTVGRLELPAQDTESAAGKAIASAVEKMSFDPWHALVAHRPLGAIMRARNAAYRLSTAARAATSELEVVAPSAVDSGAEKH